MDYFTGAWLIPPKSGPKRNRLTRALQSTVCPEHFQTGP